MEERRRTPRIKEENEVTITVVSEENNLKKEKIIDNYTKNISVSGTKIQTNILLPVDTLIELEFTSKGLRQQINAIGQVKWVKVIIEDESYEVGVEFLGTPNDAIKKLEDYISWKLKSSNKLIKQKLSPIDSGDPNISETKELPSTNSGDINTIETKEQPPTDPGDINISETKEQTPIKNKQWTKIAILSLCIIILIVVLLNSFGFIPEFGSVLVPTQKVTPTPLPKVTPVPEAKVTSAPVPESTQASETETNISPAPAPTESQSTEATAIPAPIQTATPAPAPKETPTQETKQKIKVVGNSDSKRYHLPGMKYYNSVKAYHRVEFDSEADAIKAGYHKALDPSVPAPKVEVAPAPATPKAAPPQATGVDSNSLNGRYPEGSQRILHASDFANKSAYDLKILKNEIYARHGYIFKTNDLIKYFSKQPWYKPKHSDIIKYLNKIERDNINTINNYEKSKQ